MPVENYFRVLFSKSLNVFIWSRVENVASVPDPYV